jgi:hypothetical protein
MKREQNLLDRFDQLSSIEPSENWDRQLMNRVQLSGRRSHKDYSGRLVLYVILLLLAFNIFSFSKSWMNEQSLQSSNNLRNIASDYLISTNSSKF